MLDGMGRSRSGTFIWVTAFILANFRGTVFWDVFQQGFKLTSLPWIEVSIWIVLVALVIDSLVREKLLASYLPAWNKNKILMVFIGIAVFSIFWSVSFKFSLYRISTLLCSSIVAAYIGIRFSVRGCLGILHRFGTILMIVCLVLALFLPIAGVMLWEPYTGSWRGVFWHKNHLGGIAALFNMVFLIGALDQIRKDKNKIVLNAVFYLLTIVIIYFSRSAAGYMLFILMNFFVLLGYFWIRFYSRIRRVHYYGILGLGLFVAIAVILNLDFVFGLFGRDATLTGRSSLWLYLIQNVVARSPWLGYGFGAVWGFNAFRISTQQFLGWGFPVVMADNGFLDILIHVGMVGFIPFLGVLVTAFVRSLRYALEQKNIPAFFPLFLLVFSLLANISFSYFLEVETFVWLVNVTMIFAVAKESQAFTS